jgi:hypothetical protein
MKKILYILITSLLIFISCIFAPGSYPYAEIYEFDVSEEILINAAENFKKENPEYNLFNQERFKDGKRNKKDHWYHIWFYYSQDNIIVKCWIRNNEVAFVGLGDGMNLNNYKEVNKDFTRKENKAQKDKFEKLILNKIKEYIQ